MIARLFALLAVLALALGPLNAAAATVACQDMHPVASPADGAAMDMPCCDPDPSAPMDPACAAKCVVMAGVVADLPPLLVVDQPALTWTAYAVPPTRFLRAHPPPPLDRPPRPLA